MTRSIKSKRKYLSLQLRIIIQRIPRWSYESFFCLVWLFDWCVLSCHSVGFNFLSWLDLFYWCVLFCEGKCNVLIIMWIIWIIIMWISVDGWYMAAFLTVASLNDTVFHLDSDGCWLTEMRVIPINLHIPQNFLNQNITTLCVRSIW